MVQRKKETDEELKRKLDHAVHKGKDAQDTAVEALRTPIMQGLPTTWESADGKTHLRGADAQVIGANGQDVQRFGFAPPRVCGTCRYFDVENARKKMVQEDFLRKLVNDYEWKTKYLGVTVDHIGLCGASDGSKCTTSISNASACDQYRESTWAARGRKGSRG